MAIKIRFYLQMLNITKTVQAVLTTAGRSQDSGVQGFPKNNSIALQTINLQVTY